MIERTSSLVTLQSWRFRIGLSLVPETTCLVEEFRIASAGDGHFDTPVRLVPWTGFAGITSHTHEFFVTTESPQSPQVEILSDTPDRCSVRYGPLQAASWRIHWTLTLADDELHWNVHVLVGRRTLPDDEVNLLAFDVPEGEEFVQARFDTGYILPPKEWFAIEPIEVTYRGNDEQGGAIDRRTRFKFAGDGHETLYLDFAGGYGLSLTCHEDNVFRLVPKVILKPSPPRDPRRLAPARF